MTLLSPQRLTAVTDAIDKHLRDEFDAAGAKPTAAGTLLRISDAHKCARAIGFGAIGAPKEPLTVRSLLAFKEGTFLHEVVQEAMVAGLGARCEEVVDYSPGLSLSGSCDGVYEDDNGTVAVEIKTVAEWGFWEAIGRRKRNGATAPGPTAQHLTQAGLYALAPQIDANRVHMVYISKNTGELAEWVLFVDESLPHLDGASVRQLAEAELVRLATIAAQLEDRVLPERTAPGFGVIENPADKSAPWICRYCSHRPLCADLATGPVEIVKKESE